MNVSTAKTELFRRVLSWTTLDFSREVASDFPILSTYGLNNRYVLGFVHWFRTLEESTQETLKRVLPELALASCLSCIEEPMPAKDQKKWREMVCKGESVARNQLPPLVTANKQAPGFVPIDKHQMLDYLARHLAPVFGKTKSKKGLTLEYVNHYSDWNISTKITLGSRWASEVRHEFTVRRKDYGRMGLQTISDLRPLWRRTLAGLWGITNSEWWGIPSQQDMEPVTKSLVTICEHFMREFPPLLSGLNCSD